MHPKQICIDLKSMGSSLTVEGNDLYIENPENICPEIEDLVKSYKPYIINFLRVVIQKKIIQLNRLYKRLLITSWI